MAALSNKEKALIALLTTDTNRKAAKESGLSEATLYRYLREDAEFVAEYRKRRKALMENVIGKAQSIGLCAVEALRKNLTSSNPAAVNQAAKIVLDLGVRGIDQAELLERLEVLEANAD